MDKQCKRCSKNIDDDDGDYCDVCRPIVKQLSLDDTHPAKERLGRVIKKCQKCGWYADESAVQCPHCGSDELAPAENNPIKTDDKIDLLARCEQHLHVIKGILIAGAAYLIVKELIVLFIALSK